MVCNDTQCGLARVQHEHRRRCWFNAAADAAKRHTRAGLVGYDSYLLGHDSRPTRHRGTLRGVQFIPLSGSLWDDTFELGRDPHALSFPWTWFDFVSVRSGSEESAIIEEIVERSVCSRSQKKTAAESRL